MPKPDGSLTAVVISGGKQYRVAPGDRILVDRLAAEAGSELRLERVLMIANEKKAVVTPAELAGQLVTARVVGHRRGPKVDVIRYKPKKRVRVHRGSRAELTALEILSIGAAKPARSRSKQGGADDTGSPGRRPPGGSPPSGQGGADDTGSPGRRPPGGSPPSGQGGADDTGSPGRRPPGGSPPSEKDSTPDEASQENR